jgi:DNA invertase Pin-like site-specific DNA recombinase
MSRQRKRPTGTVRAIAYTRVSTGRQAESGLGLTDQLATVTAAIELKGWVLVHHAEDAGLSARTMRRPALAEAVGMLDRGDADALVCAKADRLSRSLRDLATLLERAERRGWKLVLLDLDVDTSTPAGELLANMLGSAARFESRRIGERVAAAHRVRRAQGKRAGQAPVLPANVRARIAAERAAGKSLPTIAAGLNAEGVPTAKGGTWHPSTVAHVLRSIALDAELATAGDKR